MTSRNDILVAMLAFALHMTSAIGTAFATCPTAPSGYDCECNGDDTKWVCATWSQGPAPIEGQDFIVTYDGDIPEVKFAAADTGWEVYSEEISSGDAADIGDVLLADDVSPDSGVFVVSIKKPSGVGADNVASIVLDSADESWSGHSTLNAGTILGNVGEITVVEDGSGNGGELQGTVTIAGNVGWVNIPTIEGTLFLDGDLADADIGTVSSGAYLYLDGDLTGGVPPHDLDIDTLAGTVFLYGNVTHSSILTIGDFEGSAVLKLYGDGTYGTVKLLSGIDSSDALVEVAYLYYLVDLYNGDVDGVLSIFTGVSGSRVENGGAVEGIVNVGNNPNGPAYAAADGSLKFASVAAGGEIVVDEDAGAMQGNIEIGNDMLGLIELEGDLQEGQDPDTGVITIGGDLGGTIECQGDVADGAQITIDDAMTGTSKVVVEGACDGAISVGENTTSNTKIHCKSSLGGTGTVIVNYSEGEFSAAGQIIVGSASGAPVTGDYDGCVAVLDESGSGDGGDLDGRVRIAVCDDETDTQEYFDHALRIDGDVNGTIDIANSSCTNQPSYTAGGACSGL